MFTKECNKFTKGSNIAVGRYDKILTNRAAVAERIA